MLESEAMQHILSERTAAATGKGGADAVDDMRSLYAEYEERESYEALFVKDLDILDCLMQADAYEENDKALNASDEINKSDKLDLSQFFESAAGKLRFKFARDVETLLRVRHAARMTTQEKKIKTNSQREDVCV